MTISESGLEAEKPAKGLHYQGYVEPDRTKGGVRLRSTTGHHILHSILVATLIAPLTHSPLAQGQTQGVQNPGLGAGLNQGTTQQRDTDRTDSTRLRIGFETNKLKAEADQRKLEARQRDQAEMKRRQEEIANLIAKARDIEEKAQEVFNKARKDYFADVESLKGEVPPLKDYFGSDTAATSVKQNYNDVGEIINRSPQTGSALLVAYDTAKLTTARPLGAAGTGTTPKPRKLKPSEYKSHFPMHLEAVTVFGSTLTGVRALAEKSRLSIARQQKEVAKEVHSKIKKYGPDITEVEALVEKATTSDAFRRRVSSLVSNVPADKKIAAYNAYGVDHKLTSADKPDPTLDEALAEGVADDIAARQIAFEGEVVVAIADKAAAKVEESEKLERSARKLREQAQEVANQEPPNEEANTPGAEDVPEAPGGGGDEGGEQAGAGGGQGGGGGGGDGQGGGGSGGTGGGIPFGGSPPGFQGPRAPGEAVANTTAANKQDYRGLTKAEIGNQDLNLPTLPASQRPVRAAQRPARQLASLGGIPDLGDRSTPGGVTPPGGNGFLGGGGGGNQPQSFGAGGGVGGQFQGDPFRFASPYGRRGAKLKAPITVAYGSGSANSGGSSAGTINTGAGSSSAASKQILQGAGGRGAANGVFGVFGANNILQKACKNSERRARIGKMCREARRITVTVAEAEPERKPASSKAAGKTSKQIASPDITL